MSVQRNLLVYLHAGCANRSHETFSSCRRGAEAFLSILTSIHRCEPEFRSLSTPVIEKKSDCLVHGENDGDAPWGNRGNNKRLSEKSLGHAECHLHCSKRWVAIVRAFSVLLDREAGFSQSHSESLVCLIKRTDSHCGILTITQSVRPGPTVVLVPVVEQKVRCSRKRSDYPWRMSAGPHEDKGLGEGNLGHPIPCAFAGGRALTWIIEPRSSLAGTAMPAQSGAPKAYLAREGCVMSEADVRLIHFHADRADGTYKTGPRQLIGDQPQIGHLAAVQRIGPRRGSVLAPVRNQEVPGLVSVVDDTHVAGRRGGHDERDIEAGLGHGSPCASIEAATSAFEVISDWDHLHVHRHPSLANGGNKRGAGSCRRSAAQFSNTAGLEGRLPMASVLALRPHKEKCECFRDGRNQHNLAWISREDNKRHVEREVVHKSPCALSTVKDSVSFNWAEAA